MKAISEVIEILLIKRLFDQRVSFFSRFFLKKLKKGIQISDLDSGQKKELQWRKAFKPLP